jgi:hypothetical protein
MRRYGWSVLILGLVTALVLARGKVAEAEQVPGPETLSLPVQAQATDLLRNGDMEEGFYWKYPNHYVAKGWLRWWIKRTTIPEYDSTRAWRPWHYDGNRAQTYFKYGVPYTAGILQRVAVEPCIYYEFSIYGRNHSNSGCNHRARVGIDPRGQELNDEDNPGIYGFPSRVVWSPKKTYYEVWGLHSVVAEAQADHITVITYASPEEGFGYYDTFWDAGSLTYAPYPGDRLPNPTAWTPDGFVTDVVSRTVGGYLVIGWNTATAAPSEVRYRVLTPTSPVTPTESMTHTRHFPLVMSSVSPGLLTLSTGANPFPTTEHAVAIGGLESGQIVDFVALSRRLQDGACQTSTSAVFRATVQPGPVYPTYLPLMASE